MTNIDANSIIGVLAAVAIVCNAIGRAIPDTATGALGVVRQLAKVVGLYVPNRTV